MKRISKILRKHAKPVWFGIGTALLVTLGFIDYEWRGCAIHRASAPQGLWHFDRAAAHARSLAGEAGSRFGALLQRTGGERVMAIRLARLIRRENYVLVLA